MMNNLQARDKVDDCGCHAHNDTNDHEKPAPDHLLTYVQRGQALILGLKLCQGKFLATKSLDQ